MSVANVAAIVEKARSSWLKNNEVLDLLEAYADAGLAVCQEPPVRPDGGQLFLFDRRVCRFFRRDGHNWRKKPDGKTIRETHEKLKVGNAETLNCYYAHADQEDGLQRRCYWQLDPDKEHTVLVHYLCCASSRAGGATAAPRTNSSDLSDLAGSAVATRPRRESLRSQRRAYSPPPASGRARRCASQSKLSPLATASSLESSLVSQGSGASADVASLGADLADSLAVLPLVQGMGMSMEQAQALPSLAQQYAMEQAVQQQQAVQQAVQQAQLLAAQQQQMLTAQHVAQQQQQLRQPQVQLQPAAAPVGKPQLGKPHLGKPHLGLHSAAGILDMPSGGLSGAALELDDCFSFLDDKKVSHAGVLYCDQRMAGQLAAAQAAGAAPQAPVLAPARTLYQQESFASEQHRALFREMSLGIQRETVDESGGSYLLGTGSPPQEHPLAALAVGGDASKTTSGAAGRVASPGPDLAALLSSPPHGGGGHRRTLSRGGSGLSRLISKNWESDLQMELLLPDIVDADITTLPVGGGVVVDVAPRQTSPSSRIVDRAGIAFFGCATGAHALEPSPAHAVGLVPAGPDADYASPLPLAAVATAAVEVTPVSATPLGSGLLGSSPLGSGSPLSFVAGDSGRLAQRAAAVKDRSSRRDLTAAAFGMPRVGSHGHLAHLHPRGGGQNAEAAAEEQEAQRRKERAEAAATAAQEHRDEKLAEKRSRRTAVSSSDDAEDELIEVPGSLQRLSSFLQQRSPARTTTGDRDALAALAAAGQTSGPLVRSITAEMKDFLSAGGLTRTVTAEMKDFLASGGPLARTVTAEMRDLLAAGNGGGNGGGGLARTGTVDMMAAEALEAEARSLFKHMSIDEEGGVAAAAYAKELDVLPTIHATGSSEVEAASGQRGSMVSDGVASQESSLLDTAARHGQ